MKTSKFAYFLLASVFLAGLWMGIQIGSYSVQKEAIEHGVAERSVGSTGLQFNWIR